MDPQAEVAALADEFRVSQRVLTALGDEVRQHLILVMMQSGRCGGMRVLDIAAGTNLSRPAVSHHLKILKDAGIVSMRREGTRNYYYFDPNMVAFDQLATMLDHAQKILKALPRYEDLVLATR